MNLALTSTLTTSQNGAGLFCFGTEKDFVVYIGYNTMRGGTKMNGWKRLTEIAQEQICFVQEVQGEEKLRLFDLGFFRGSRVLPLYECAGGGTRVYRVKDTLIALRNGDAEVILAEEAGEREQERGKERNVKEGKPYE